jgi:general nucleoside transport system permease protein
MSAPVLTEAETAPAATRGTVRLVRTVLPYVLALVLAFLVAGIVIAILGYDPVEAFRTIFSTSFRTGFGFT